MAVRGTTAFTSAKELQEKIEAYFAHCESTRSEQHLKNGDVKIRYEEACSMVGLARFLGVHKAVLYTYIDEEEKRGLDPEEAHAISELLQDARERIEQVTLSRSLSGDYDPRVASRILSGFGYTEKTEGDGNSVLVKIQGASSADVEAWSK